MEHTKLMQIALAQAQKSADRDEVPVGAVVVAPDGKILARAHNLTETRNTQAAHAEVLAITKAGKKLGDWRLNGCWLYVTLEPCAMCFELIILSRLAGVVFGAKSPLFGYSLRLDQSTPTQDYPRSSNTATPDSATLRTPLDRVVTPPLYNDRRLPEVIAGVGAEQAAALLKEFFKRKRV